jgi:hypothetical protein
MSFTGKPVHEILEVRAQPRGFSLVLGKPLADDLELITSDLLAQQWFYHPTEQYGGPKYDLTELPIAALQLSADRRIINATIDGLKPGYVVYLRLNDRLVSADNDRLWTNEAWYTLNHIPLPPAENGDIQPLSASTPEADAQPRSAPRSYPHSYTRQYTDRVRKSRRVEIAL